MNQPKSHSDLEPKERKERTRKIAELNDRLRRTGDGGSIVMTHGVQALEDETRARLFMAIRDFDAFDEDCDPHGEHDFGIVKLEGQSFYFKHDYYDRNLEFASPDPADASVTKRVMTVLLAEEY